MIKLERTTTDYPSYHIYYNDVFLGATYQDESGYFNFYHNNNTGYWSAHSLRLIADKLDELNKEWDDYIKQNLK